MGFAALSLSKVEKKLLPLASWGNLLKSCMSETLVESQVHDAPCPSMSQAALEAKARSLFCVNLRQARLDCEEGTLIEKKSLSDCGQAWGVFS